MLRALGSASCDSRHETGGTICYGHWVLHLVIADTRRGGTKFYGHWVPHLKIADTRQGHDVLRALGSASCDSRHEKGVRIATGIGF